ncbi:3-oxoadipate enol-lactonase 2 [Pandoraea pneumonica]|jgi:pimeloyl-ACP methyl ester carboxylesterase|uniref:3-oxoadipate enol-lactonase 2 n=1 Tax=Pandoraea pneumonica TaxID=2508299 RepID=A0A5E4V3B9_9BURK|nr:alpha/beta hydrolase [Pandoraea pneumonica]VVE05859.1 3-oxoadipate enol-lactonase 2 [Pandoraea pneumonica]
MSTARPPLLMLPGLLCDQVAWAATAALLPQHDCRVPAWGMLDSIEAMARHVLASVAEPRFAVAGHSMGGRIALEVVRLAPERVTHLALLDTGYQALPEGEAAEKERAGRAALLARAREAGMRAMGQVWATGMVHPDQIGTPLFDAILDMIERSNPDQFAAQIHALLGRPEATPQLGGIHCPTLVLCGRQDTWSPLARHEIMAGAIPGAKLSVIEDSGHMSPMERPQEVAAALQAWLDTRTHGMAGVQA